MDSLPKIVPTRFTCSAFFLLLTIGGFSFACGDDGGSTSSGSETPDSGGEGEGEGEREPGDVTWSTFSERPCPEDSNLTYENFGEPFMLNWCTGCHAAGLSERERAGAPVGVDLDSHEDMQTYMERIWARSGDLNETMPPVGGPSELERWMLAEWLACGAP